MLIVLRGNSGSGKTTVAEALQRELGWPTAVLEQAGHLANTWMIAKYDQLNPPALKRLLAGGTKLHAFSPEIMDACYKAAMELHAEIAKENAPFKKVNDSLMDYTKSAYQWMQVAGELERRAGEVG